MLPRLILTALLALVALPASAQADVTVNGTTGDDTIIVTATGATTGTYQVNGNAPVPFSDGGTFTVNGSDGNDAIRIENPTGALFTPAVLNVNGDAGSEDAVALYAGTADTIDFIPQGTTAATHVARRGNTFQPTHINGAENVVELNQASLFRFFGSAGNDTINITDAANNAAPRFQVPGQLGVDFARKLDARVVADDGSDTINVDTDAFNAFVGSIGAQTGDDTGDVINLGFAAVNSFGGGDGLYLENRSGPINDANGTATNVSAPGFRFDAGTNVGTLVDPIETNTNRYVGKTKNGSIALVNESPSSEINVGSPDGTSGLEVTDSGTVSVTTTDGPINLVGPVESGDTAGGVLLTANGVAGHIRGRGNGAATTAPAGGVLMAASKDIELGVSGGGVNNDVAAHNGVTLTAGGSVRLGGDSDVVADRDDQTTFTANVTGAVGVEIGTAETDGSSVQASDGVTVTATTGTLTVRAGGIDGGVNGRASTRLRADHIALGANALVQATGVVDVASVTAGRGFDLGSATDASSTAIELSDSEFARFAGPALVLDADALSGHGAIGVTAPVDLPNVTTLSLKSGTGITSSSSPSLAVPQLAVRTSAAVSLPNVDIDRLALAASGQSAIADTDGMTIATVDGVAGVTAPQLQLDAAGALAFEAPATVTGGGEILLSAQNGVSQTAAGVLYAARLRADGASVSLAAAPNEVGVVAGRATGSFALRDEQASGWRTGVVGLRSGVTSQLGDVDLRSTRETRIQSGVSAPNGRATVSAPAARVAIGGPVEGRNATIAARHLELEPVGWVDVGSGTATLRTADGRVIALGDTTAVPSGDDPAEAAISDAELDLVTAGTVEIGHDDGGIVDISAGVSPANAQRLVIRGASITQATPADVLAAGRVALYPSGAAGAPGDPIDIAADRLEAFSPAGPIFVRDPDDLTLGGTGVASGGQVVVEAGGAIELAQPVVAGTQAMLKADGFTRTADGEFSAPDVTLTDTGSGATAWTLAPGSLKPGSSAAIPYSNVNDLRITGGSGADSFAVKASPTTRYHLDGADPSVAPGDTLDYDTEGRSTSGDTTAPDGQIDSPGRQPVAFTRFEAAKVTVPPPPKPQAGKPGTKPPTGGDPKPPTDPDSPPRPLPGACANVRPFDLATAFGDRLTGTNGPDVISALAGDDCVDAKAGNDRVSGGTGNDRLIGGRGNDRLTGGSGRDRISGGSGRDSLTGGSGRDTLSGGTGNDKLSGGTGNDRLTGGSGRDRLIAGKGRNRLSGGGGNDSVNARNGSRDVVVCGAGRDTAKVDRRDVVRGCERVLRR